MPLRKVVLFTVAALTGVSLACSEGGSRDVPLGPTGPGSANLTAPTPQSPVSDVQLTTLRPTFVVGNGSGSGSGARTYEFQVSDRNDFLVAIAARQGVPEGTGGTTSFTPDVDLAPSTRMYWRARMTQGADTSAWSTIAQFRTRIAGFNRPGEMFDPLTNGETIGTASGSTTFMGAQGIRINDMNSWVRYTLAATLTSGEISVEVEGLAPNRPSEKARIFSMQDGTGRLFDSRYLFNVQYRGIPGNPDNAISYKLLMGSDDLKYEPDFGQRAAGVRALNPATTYLWTATWGNTFRLIVREGGVTGPVIYDRSHDTPGLYSPTPHSVFLGANDANIESGSFAGAIYRNLWVGTGPRPASLGSALRR